MRTKTRDGLHLKPGMVIRGRGVDTYGLDMTPLRQIAAVTKVFGWPHDRWITFTDGSQARIGVHQDFETARNGAAARAATIPSLALATALGLLGAYATA